MALETQSKPKKTQQVFLGCKAKRNQNNYVVAEDMIENLNDCEGVEQAKIGVQLLPKVYSNESNA